MLIVVIKNRKLFKTPYLLDLWIVYFSDNNIFVWYSA